MRIVLWIVLIALLTLPVEAQDGCASWYGPGFYGRLTTSGEVFTGREMTCASWHFPLGSRLEVEYCGKKIIVRVNDRGGLNLLDLSEGAFRELAPLGRGIIRVKVRRL